MIPQPGLLPALEALQNIDEDGCAQWPIENVKGHPGWLTNGYVAVFVGDGNSGRFEDSQPSAESAFSKMLTMSREPATEDVAFRIPGVLADVVVRKKCTNCDGDGVEECELGFEHDCHTCDGDGRIGKRGALGMPGQRVYRSVSRNEIKIADKSGALLDGLTVVALGSNELDPIAGQDDLGDLVVVAMPMRGRAEIAKATP